MSGKRLAGHCLLWIGFLSGAFVAVRSTEVADAPWSTISWPLYAVGIAIAVGGVFLLRTTQPGRDESDDTHTSNIAGLEALLGKILGHLRSWQTAEGRLPVFQVHGAIDRDIADDLAEFADLRQSMVRAFGLQQYARVMTEFALAERSINRMWSASADGYVDEVDRSNARAVNHLEAALERLREAQAEA